MRIRAAGWSDRGAVRRANEDCYCLGRRVTQDACTSLALDAGDAQFATFGLLAAVADGLGGYAGGALASRVLLEALRDEFYAAPHAGASSAELAESMAQHLRAAWLTLAGVLRAAPDLQEAGTTVAGIALLPPRALVVFHAGDSRVLRASGGYLRQLTVDHTPVGADLASGRMSEADAAATGTSHQLLRAIGLDDAQPPEVQADYTGEPGDLFFIGTDGWHGVGHGIPREELRELARQGGDPEALVRTMIGRAVAGDGTDNATVVVVQLDEAEAA